MNGWDDINIDSANSNSTHDGILYCTSDYTESCIISSSDWQCADNSNQCLSASSSPTILPTTSPIIFTTNHAESGIHSQSTQTVVTPLRTVIIESDSDNTKNMFMIAVHYEIMIIIICSILSIAFCIIIVFCFCFYDLKRQKVRTEADLNDIRKMHQLANTEELHFRSLSPANFDNPVMKPPPIRAQDKELSDIRNDIAFNVLNTNSSIPVAPMTFNISASTMSRSIDNPCANHFIPPPPKVNNRLSVSYNYAQSAPLQPVPVPPILNNLPPMPSISNFNMTGTPIGKRLSMHRDDSLMRIAQIYEEEGSVQERFDHPANDFIVMDEAATIPLNEMDSDSLSDRALEMKQEIIDEPRSPGNDMVVDDVVIQEVANNPVLKNELTPKPDSPTLALPETIDGSDDTNDISEDQEVIDEMDDVPTPMDGVESLGKIIIDV